MGCVAYLENDGGVVTDVASEILEAVGVASDTSCDAVDLGRDALGTDEYPKRPAAVGIIVSRCRRRRRRRRWYGLVVVRGQLWKSSANGCYLAHLSRIGTGAQCGQYNTASAVVGREGASSLEAAGDWELEGTNK